MDLNKIAPAYLGEQRLTLALRDLGIRPRVGLVLVLTIDYSACDPEGVVLPLIYTVTQPDGTKLTRRLYKLVPPAVVDFVPEVSGTHLVRIGEAFHNRWWGSLQVPVIGDALES